MVDGFIINGQQNDGGDSATPRTCDRDPVQNITWVPNKQVVQYVHGLWCVVLQRACLYPQ